MIPTAVPPAIKAIPSNRGIEKLDMFLKMIRVWGILSFSQVPDAAVHSVIRAGCRKVANILQLSKKRPILLLRVQPCLQDGI